MSFGTRKSINPVTRWSHWLGFCLGTYLTTVLLGLLIDPLLAVFLASVIAWPILLDGALEYSEFLLPVIGVSVFVWLAVFLWANRSGRIGVGTGCGAMLTAFAFFIVAGDVRAKRVMQVDSQRLEAKCFERRGFLRSVLGLGSRRNWHARLRLESGQTYVWSYKFMEFDIASSDFDHAQIVCNEG